MPIMDQNGHFGDFPGFVAGTCGFDVNDGVFGFRMLMMVRHALPVLALPKIGISGRNFRNDQEKVINKH